MQARHVQRTHEATPSKKPAYMKRPAEFLNTQQGCSDSKREAETETYGNETQGAHCPRLMSEIRE